MDLLKHSERQNGLSRQIRRSFFEMSCRLVLSDGSRTRGNNSVSQDWPSCLPPDAVGVTSEEPT